MTASREYSIAPARYAQKSVAVRPADEVHGFVERVGRLCQALNARWSNRERAYIMSEAKGRKFEALYAAGRDARLKFDSIYSARYELSAEVSS